MSDTDFYDVDELEKTAVNLFYGWGYNFYRLENQLRADDLTVRAKSGGCSAWRELQSARRKAPTVGSVFQSRRGRNLARTPRPSRARGCWSSYRKRSERSRGKFARSPFPKTIE
jgi:hypothetical protein